MHQRKAIYQHGHVIAVRPVAFVASLRGVLIDHLQGVPVDVRFVDQPDVFGRAVLSDQVFLVINLHRSGLFHDASRWICYLCSVETVPLRIGEAVLVELFQLLTKIVTHCLGSTNISMLISLVGELVDKGIFKISFGLVPRGTLPISCVASDDR